MRTYGRMKLKNRTAARWQAVIEQNVAPEDWPKVCSVIWWDFVQMKNTRLRPGEWFFENMYSYDWDSQYTNEHLKEILSSVGYKKRMGAYHNGLNQNNRNGRKEK